MRIEEARGRVLHWQFEEVEKERKGEVERKPGSGRSRRSDEDLVTHWPRVEKEGQQGQKEGRDDGRRGRWKEGKKREQLLE